MILNILLVVMTIIASLTLDSVIEWWTHRYPMHKKLPGPLFRFLFEHHVTVHHAKFSGDAYEHHHEDERGTIPFPLWVGPLLIAVAVSPFWAISYWTGTDIPLWTSLIVAVLYYIAFEGIHQLMHLPDSPKVRWIRESKWFVWLNTHHKIHHARAGSNFNLVLPLADWMFETLLSYEGFLKVKK